MKTFVNNCRLTAAAVMFTAGLAGQASAEAVHEQAASEAGVSIATVSIPYATAELSTEPGRSELYRKIRQAAREVCGPTGLRDAGGLANSSRNRKCYKEAVAVAISQVGSSQLAAIARY